MNEITKEQKESPVEAKNSVEIVLTPDVMRHTPEEIYKMFTEQPIQYMQAPMRNKHNVLEWGNERGLLKSENALKQFAKMISEAGELGDAIIKSQPDKIQDGIGDTLVTLIILSAQLGYDIEDCLQIAYDEIKNRKGVTVDGTFIKD